MGVPSKTRAHTHTEDPTLFGEVKRTREDNFVDVVFAWGLKIDDPPVHSLRGKPQGTLAMSQNGKGFLLASLEIPTKESTRLRNFQMSSYQKVERGG